MGLETGGRWSTEATTFVDMLAAGRAREVPSVLRRSNHLAWRRRWTRMLAVSCGRSFADSLVSAKWDTWKGTEGARPDLVDLFGEQ